MNTSHSSRQAVWLSVLDQAFCVVTRQRVGRVAQTSNICEAAITIATDATPNKLQWILRELLSAAISVAIEPTGPPHDWVRSTVGVEDLNRFCWILISLMLCLATSDSFGQEANTFSLKNVRPVVQVTYRLKNKQESSLAEVVREFADGSLLLQVPDGRLLSLHTEEILSSEVTSSPMKPMTADELVTELQEELGAEFRFYKTKHFVIAFNTSQIYAEWVGQLFERFYKAFVADWSKRKAKLEEPRFPLVAIVFSNKGSYLEYAHRDIGESASSLIGYYNMNSNRMIMYDLTGVDGMVPANEKVSSQAVINSILSQPQAERTVATIVHEAVHQLAYNSGLQTRLADNPLWLSEGLAMYFEAPDLNSPQGWKIGNVNYYQLRMFLAYLPRRPVDSIQNLISDDNRFKDSESVAAAYSESWALTYFLMKARRKPLTDYMKEISALEPLAEPDPRLRLEMLEKHFGDLQKLDRDFINFVRQLR